MLQYLFENACASSTVDYFENNAFALPRAENKLVLFQDDLKKDKLKSTEVFKMMVKRMEELKQLRAADEITQTVFDREVSFIQEAIKSQRIALVEEAKKNFVSTFQKMREIANNRIIKPPTAEIVNTLQLLSMLDEITPTQFNLYAAQMEDTILEKAQEEAVTSCSLFILYGVIDYIDDSELGDTETGEYIKQMLRHVTNLLRD